MLRSKAAAPYSVFDRFAKGMPGLRCVLAALRRSSRAAWDASAWLAYCGRESAMQFSPDASQVWGELVEEVRLNLVQRALADCVAEPPGGNMSARPVRGADLGDGGCGEARVCWSCAAIGHVRNKRA